MRRLILPVFFALRANAASIVSVADLKIFSQLAPCAASAIKYNIQYLTNKECPEPVTELQSCVCTKNNNLASVSARISSSVSYSCGGTASDDQSSVATVLSAYCNQASVVAFPTPTAVSAYITDIPEVDNLAPCAKTALRYAVNTLTYSKCPDDAPGLASCACLKNQNSLLVSQIINTSAKYHCSGHTADISSAQAMFAAYCQLNTGTANFPVPSKPPGDMSYYITDLPQYSSLAPCAMSAIKYVIQSQTYDLCPSGPQALASCVCFKDQMTNDLLKTLTSSVKYSCSSTATEDISSAVAVYNLYCSAAAGQFTAAGVTASFEQTYPKGASGAPKATDSGSGGSGGSSSSTNGGNGNGDGSEKSGVSIPVIAGAIGGVVVGLALIGAAIFIVRRSAKKRREEEQLAASIQAPGNGGNNNTPAPMGYYAPNGGKPELAADALPAPPPPASPSPSTLKVNSPSRTDNVSPVSAHHTGGTFTPPPNQASLYPPMPQNTSELPSPASTGYPSPGFQQQQNMPQPYGQGPPPELYGQGVPNTNRPELQGQGAMYAPAPDRPELAGQGTHFHNAAPNRPELMGQGAMYAPAPDRPELAGQGSHYHNANPNRPELQGQNMMFAPPPSNGAQELHGQGPPPPQQQPLYQQHQQAPYHIQNQYPQPPQSPYPQPPQSPYPQHQQIYQQQQPIQPPQQAYQPWQPGMGQQQQGQGGPQPGQSWQPRPPHMLHEMDGGYNPGQGGAGESGVAR
ncbi:hypothetical protein QBC38DRAFT_351974 [Podospora fimiseda]|uniref:Uncharacterized protein n=1 Tax=Podospora fimiseda TaxID=252190 RepID=A0AAN7BZW6_9PEZI|nr:hypothetical protein QBC38DRAFT_351974 [Podospora fimiseda]